MFFFGSLLVLALFPLFSLRVRATDFSSASFIVKDPVIKPGSGFSTSTNFQLFSSIGQEAIGISAGGTFGLKAGFLYFPTTSTPTTTPTNPPSPPPPPPAPGSSGSGGAGAPIYIPGQKPPLGPGGGLICDFNDSGSCDIIDLSIMLYYMSKPYTLESERYDFNSDGTIDIVDISILFYYWTG